MKKALVLMNMWASRNKKEFKTFLKNMFMDEKILPIKNIFVRKIVSFLIVRKIYKKNWSNFEKIWWNSPMHNLTENLVKILEKIFPEYFITYSMRYTKPFSKEVIKKLKEKNIEEIILFTLYPHNSIASNISSLEDFEKNLKKNLSKDFNPVLKKIDAFYQNKIYNDLIIKNILEKVNKNFSDYEFIFSAHSLPKRVIEAWDTYEKHIEKNVEILKKEFEKNNMNFNSITLAYQSKVGKEKWLEPSLWTILQKFKWKKVIIYPISFTIENSETVYELDIEYKELAKKYWVKEYLRVDCLNEKISKMIEEEIKNI